MRLSPLWSHTFDSYFNTFQYGRFCLTLGKLGSWIHTWNFGKFLFFSVVLVLTIPDQNQACNRMLLLL